MLTHSYKETFKRLSAFIGRWMLLSAVTFILYWILWCFVDHNVYNEGGYSLDLMLFDLAYCCFFTLCVMLISHIVEFLLSRWMSKRWTFLLASLIILITNIVIAHAFEYVTDEYFNPYYVSATEFVEGIYIYSLVATVLSILLLSDHHYRLYAKELEERKHNDMALLKRQLDPHFMFNSLNALDALMESDIDTAHRYLNKLSLCYRYIVKNINVDKIKICSAIDFIKQYRELLQINAPGNFQIRIELCLEHSQDYIVPMSIQLLVENAVKHNRHSESEPIHISITTDGNYIIVTNTFRPISSSVPSTQIGLNNLRKRCAYVTGKECIVEQMKDLFEVKIPIIKNN